MSKRILRVSLLAALLVLSASAQLEVQTIDVAGDSISKGFNAGSSPCANADQEQLNWLTSDTHGTSFCDAGVDGVFSFLERLECDLNRNILAALPNHAESGARMLGDFPTQAAGIRTYLNSQPGPRIAAVFLGHNDNCSGSLTKINASCAGPDLDPNNHCRTRADSFERDFRRGLELLMTVPDTRIGVSSPVRVSQLCNFGSKANCQLGPTCQSFWNFINVCGSLTRSCSNERIVDTYNTIGGYRDILKNVTAEYAAIPEGGNSRIITIAGATVGGALKATGTHFVYSDAAWRYRFNADQLSCCDCFHPSAYGQDTLGRLAKSGLTCSRVNPCCKETGDPLTDAKCAVTERKAAHYPGLY